MARSIVEGHNGYDRILVSFRQDGREVTSGAYASRKGADKAIGRWLEGLDPVQRRFSPKGGFARVATAEEREIAKKTGLG